MSDITIATLRQTILAAADMHAYMVTNNPGPLVAMLLAPGPLAPMAFPLW